MGHRSGDCNCNAAQLQKQLLLWQKLQPRQVLPTSRDHTVNFVRLFVLTQMSFTFKFVRSSWSKYFASDLLLHLDFSVAAYLICHFAARHVQNMALCWIIAERRKLSSIICGSVWLYKLQLNIMWECEGTAASQPRYRFCLEILLALKKKIRVTFLKAQNRHSCWPHGGRIAWARQTPPPGSSLGRRRTSAAQKAAGKRGRALRMAGGSGILGARCWHETCGPDAASFWRHTFARGSSISKQNFLPTAAKLIN